VPDVLLAKCDGATGRSIAPDKVFGVVQRLSKNRGAIYHCRCVVVSK
jgi:hypothetical protein